MKIYQRFNKIDNSLKKRLYRLKYLYLSLWKSKVKKLRIQSHVAPKVFVSVYKILMKLAFKQLKNGPFKQRRLSSQ